MPQSRHNQEDAVPSQVGTVIMGFTVMYHGQSCCCNISGRPTSYICHGAKCGLRIIALYDQRNYKDISGNPYFHH